MISRMRRVGFVANHPVTEPERKVLFLALFVLIGPRLLFAASDAYVLHLYPAEDRIVISHESERVWKVRDVVCVPRGQQTDALPACGFIVLSAGCGAILQMTPDSKSSLPDIKPGMDVIAGQTDSVPFPTQRPEPLSDADGKPFTKALEPPCDNSLSNLAAIAADEAGTAAAELGSSTTRMSEPQSPAAMETTVERSPDSRYHVGAGANFFSPFVKLDWIQGNLAYGITGALSTFYQVNLLSSTSTRARLWTGMFQVDYFQDAIFSGLFARGAAGGVGGQVEIVGREISTFGGTALVAGGYRLLFSTLTAAAGVGAQYFYARDTDTVVQALSPVVFVEAGGLF